MMERQMAKTTLDPQGLRLLRLLVDHLPNVRPGVPQTYLGYKEAHDRLGLALKGTTYGESLQRQGLNNLAEWSSSEGLPAITGLIIAAESHQPGPGYFKLFGRDADDFPWWESEIRQSLRHDWPTHLNDMVHAAKDQPGEAWSDGELRATVSAYLDMARMAREGLPFVKKAIYEELATEHGRSAKAYEYRMQNISFVMLLMGRSWIEGLKPAKNLGVRNAERIEAFIMEVENRHVAPVVRFEMLMLEARNKADARPPLGDAAPTSKAAMVMQYSRDPKIKAWVLNNANGICESCDQPAPFQGADGRPFLEVHHMHTLAEGGADTVDNSVAICPNCHRALHYGADAKTMILELYGKVTRLAGSPIRPPAN
jgi:predicted HNH restriction endonuclease